VVDLLRDPRGHPAAARSLTLGVLVPVLDGRVVGFAWTGLSRDGDATGLAELYAINLHPDAWGRGAGSALLRAAQAEIAGRGHDEAVLWVVPGNTRARRFYERHGWTSDPIEVADGVSVPELRYRRSLPVSDPARR
jgi:GNAT superfamily N-acetyltransferase